MRFKRGKSLIFCIFLIFIFSILYAQVANFSLVGVQVEEGVGGSLNIGFYFSPTTGLPKFDIQQKDGKLVVTFLNTTVKMPSKSIDVNKAFLTKIELTQNEKNTIVYINFVGGVPTYIYNSGVGSLKLVLNPQLSGVSTTLSKTKESEVNLISINVDKNYKPNLIVLNFSAEVPEYKVSLLQNPLRLVIDINNTINKVTTKSISVNSSPILGVRVSQFTTKPYVTRVVVDLKTSYPKLVVKDYQNKLYIGTSEVLAKVVPVSQKVVTEVPKVEEAPKVTEVKTTTVEEKPEEKPKEEIVSKPVEVKDKFQQRISVSFDRAEIRDVLKAMGQLAGLNIITDIGVQGRISVYLKDIPFKDAFYALLASSDLGYIQQGEIIIVANLDKLQKIESRDLVTKVYQLKYFESQKAKDILSKTSKTAVFDSDDSRNWLIVSAPPSEFAKIESTIKTLDIPSESIAGAKTLGKVILEKSEDTYLVTLTAKGDDIKDILQEIIQKSGKNIIFSKDVSGGVYLTLNRVPLDRAIDLIIRSSGYIYEVREGGVILVSAPKIEGAPSPIIEIKELVKIDKIGDVFYVTASLKKSDIRDVLQEIASKTDLNFIVDPKVSGTVDLFVNKVPLDEVLTIIQRLANFDMEKVGKTYYIRPKEVQTATVPQVISTKLYVLKYITLQDILRVGGSLVKNLSLSYDDKTRLLIAQGKEDDLKVLDELISRIDVEKKEAVVSRELLTVEREGDKIYVSCDLRGADIREVLRELGKKADINFVIDQKVTGQIDLYLNKVELPEVLNIIQRAGKLSITTEDKVTYVKPYEEKVAVPVEVAKTKIYALKYITLSDIERVGGSLVKNLSLSYDDKTRLLIAQGKEDDLKVLDELISRIDVEKKEAVVSRELLTVEREGDKIYVSCDLRGADIREVLRELGKKADINFVIDQKVTGQIDLYLNKVELPETLDILSKIASISFEKVGSVTFVKPFTTAVVATKEGAPIVTKEYKLKYISLDTLKSVVSGIAKDVNFYYDQTSGLLLVQGPADQVSSVESMIAKLDKPTPQVKIDVQVIEVSRENIKDIGIEWGTGSISTGLQITANVGWQDLRISIINPGQISANIKALESQNKAKILAQPSMTTVSGKSTRIMIGDRVPLISYDAQGNRQVSFVDVGIILNVTPTVNADGTITANLNPQVSTIQGYVQDVPIISTREAQTIVNLKNGETLALGGLLRQEEIESMSKVPLLGDIPILGELFKARKIQKVERELIILITPKIIE
ncbi:bacterial type II and III secretion system protein [Dictyoglomus thermophilum H-6-12]|uniref:Bacterial type II and III secretion system protein n=1 Tax=Dictyoglomus thermophilum (strain ATCC 35947 / DSM 3960 / H-6-12) TaxID=309799 RepID=B5YDZ7_DICT6|nr:secretin N-terminal domain-containing protein [Dictyoglomus thermophilum]ACI19943.1 bacterial type II and III secretion system protein [Dictyoglomus thermophilum H-6-12]